MAQSRPIPGADGTRHYCKSLVTNRNCSARWDSSPISQSLSPTSLSPPALFPSSTLGLAAGGPAFLLDMAHRRSRAVHCCTQLR